MCMPSTCNIHSEPSKLLRKSWANEYIFAKKGRKQHWQRQWHSIDVIVDIAQHRKCKWFETQQIGCFTVFAICNMVICCLHELCICIFCGLKFFTRFFFARMCLCVCVCRHIKYVKFKGTKHTVCRNKLQRQTSNTTYTNERNNTETWNEKNEKKSEYTYWNYSPPKHNAMPWEKIVCRIRSTEKQG